MRATEGHSPGGAGCLCTSEETMKLSKVRSIVEET